MSSSTPPPAPGSPSPHPGFNVPPVKQHFHYDWNFAIAASRVNSLPAIGVAISLSALVLNLEKSVELGDCVFNLIWLAIVLYLVAVVIIKSRAPRILQEYPSFKSYLDFGHSHRWALWSLHFNMLNLSDGARLGREAVAKGLTITTPSQAYVMLPTAEIFGGTPKYREAKKKKKDARPEIVAIYQPYNVGRDLYLGLQIDGQRYVVTIEESDPSLDAKIKEMFWMIVSEAGDTNPVSKGFAWGLLSLALLSFSSAIAVSLINVAPGKVHPASAEAVQPVSIGETRNVLLEITTAAPRVKAPASHSTDAPVESAPTAPNDSPQQ
jgi:hypothetical protein